MTDPVRPSDVGIDTGVAIHVYRPHNPEAETAIVWRSPTQEEKRQMTNQIVLDTVKPLLENYRAMITLASVAVISHPDQLGNLDRAKVMRDAWDEAVRTGRPDLMHDNWVKADKARQTTGTALSEKVVALCDQCQSGCHHYCRQYQPHIAKEIPLCGCDCEYAARGRSHLSILGAMDGVVAASISKEIKPPPPGGSVRQIFNTYLRDVRYFGRQSDAVKRRIAEHENDPEFVALVLTVDELAAEIVRTGGVNPLPESAQPICEAKGCQRTAAWQTEESTCLRPLLLCDTCLESLKAIDWLADGLKYKPLE